MDINVITFHWNVLNSANLKNPTWRLQKYLFIGKVDEKMKLQNFLQLFLSFPLQSLYEAVKTFHRSKYSSEVIHLFFFQIFSLPCLCAADVGFEQTLTCGRYPVAAKDRALSAILHTAFDRSPHMSWYYNQYSRFCLIAEHIIWSKRKLIRYVGPQTV